MHLKQLHSLQLHPIKEAFLVLRLLLRYRHILLIMRSEQLRYFIQLIKALRQFLIQLDMMNSLLHLHHLPIQHLLLLRHQII